MIKILCLIFSFLLLLCGCSRVGQHDQSQLEVPSSNRTFVSNENRDIVSDTGIAYAHLANEGELYYLGDLEFVGSIEGEEKTSEHLSTQYQTGMFAIKDADNDDILICYAPNCEWFSVYRKASLREFDFSVDNCVRLELVIEPRYLERDQSHITCGDGIVDPSVIAEFLSDIRSQKSPKEAGLYDLARKPDGTLENCYVCGAIYGFFREESNLAVRMEVTSYNDLAYSVSVENKDYVLPTEWLQKLESK